MADAGASWRSTTLGRAEMTTSRIGLGSSYRLDAAGVEYAFERGVRYFY